MYILCFLFHYLSMTYKVETKRGGGKKVFFLVVRILFTVCYLSLIHKWLFVCLFV